MLLKFNGIDKQGPYYIDPEVIKQTFIREGITILVLDADTVIGEIQVDELLASVKQRIEMKSRIPGPRRPKL
jgi:hypothetical protein